MTKVSSDSDSLKALDSVGRRLAGVYAEAFLGAAAKAGSADSAFEELREIAIVFGQSDNGIHEFLSSPTVKREIKSKVIAGLSKSGVSDLLVDFICVLNDHDRVELLPAIADSVEKILLNRNGKVKVYVTSASDLDEATVHQLAGSLKSQLGKEPVLQTSINPDILGGLVIQVGDWVWDGSLSKELDGLRDQLFERGNHAIQGGRDRFRSDR